MASDAASVGERPVFSGEAKTVFQRELLPAAPPPVVQRLSRKLIEQSVTLLVRHVTPGRFRPAVEVVEERTDPEAVFTPLTDRLVIIPQCPFAAFPPEIIRFSPRVVAFASSCNFNDLVP